MKIFIVLFFWYTCGVFLANAQSKSIFDMARQNDTSAFKNWVAEVQSNFSIDTVNAQGHTLVTLASYHNHIEFLKILAPYHPDFNLPDASGNTALMGAIFKGFEPIICYLLSQNIQINQQNYNGATALIFACTFGRENIVKTLLQKGADIDIKDNFGNTALRHAEIQGNETIIQWIRSKQNLF